MNSLTPEIEREIEAQVANQIADGEYGPEPRAMPKRHGKVKAVKFVGKKIKLPTPETVIVEDRPGFPPTVPGISVDTEFERGGPGWDWT